MLAGFRSRCTTPASCAAIRPVATCLAIDSARATGSRPSRLQDRRQVRPVDVRHRDVLDALDLADVVDPDDVLVGDLTGEQQLPLEPALEVLRHHGVRRRRPAGSP